MRLIFLILVFISLFIFAYRFEPASPAPYHFSEQKMTIDYHILIGESLTSTQIKSIQTIINQTFKEIDCCYNKWNPDSEISILNRLPAYQTIALSPQLLALFKHMDQFVHLSGGRFDPTVEPLARLWKQKLTNGLIPSKEELETLKSFIGWHFIHFENGFFYKEDSRIELDLGGIAKGLCVDLLTERLNQAGFPHVFVEWGGDIRASGQHPEGRPWNVYIRRFEDPDPSKALAYISLNNQALATSGNYFQYWTVIDDQGQEHVYGHIFNPLTLHPLEVKADQIQSASLLASDCVTADSLAKILLFFHESNELEEWISKIKQDFPEVQYWIAKRDGHLSPN